MRVKIVTEFDLDDVGYSAEYGIETAGEVRTAARADLTALIVDGLYHSVVAGEGCLGYGAHPTVIVTFNDENEAN